MAAGAGAGAGGGRARGGSRQPEGGVRARAQPAPPAAPIRRAGGGKAAQAAPTALPPAATAGCSGLGESSWDRLGGDGRVQA